jgi:predicted permease
MIPAEMNDMLSPEIDPSALLFTAALTLGTGLLFGLFPALHSTRPDLVSALKGQAGQPSGGRAAARFRVSLATGQIALSMALLVAGGLFTKSLFNVSRTDLGLNVDNVGTFVVSPALNGYTPERSCQLFERLEDALAALPGATGVSSSRVPLLTGSNWGNDVNVEGFEAGPDTDIFSRVNWVGPDYFRTLGIPLLAGREFTRADALDRPKVAIVNEAFVKKFNLGPNPLGRRIGMGAGRNSPLTIEIVGFAKNAKYDEVKLEVPPLFFLPYRQEQRVSALSFFVRTSLDPEQLLSDIPRLMGRLDPNLPVDQLRTMPQQVRENVFADHLVAMLSAAFALVATLLAAVGLYGVLAYTVSQRTREIGLRMALGAAPSRVRGLVLRQVGSMTIAGGLIGLAAAIGLGRLAQSLLYQLDGNDPTVLAAALVSLTLVAIGAGLVPAQRAARVDPMTALRYE